MGSEISLDCSGSKQASEDELDNGFNFFSDAAQDSMHSHLGVAKRGTSCNQVLADKQGRETKESLTLSSQKNRESASHSTSSGTFGEIKLSRPLLTALSCLGFSSPTAIQEASLPVILRGKDVCACAVTGSGKTAAFLVPIIERLVRKPKSRTSIARVLVLLPTRELAIQCHKVANSIISFAAADIKIALITGGYSLQSQRDELQNGPDIIIATPGRLIDHVRNTRGFSLKTIEVLVLDEVDRILEEGFADAIHIILSGCPVKKQTILFSATMTEEISDMAKDKMNNPKFLFIDPNGALPKKLAHQFVRVRKSRESDRLALLLSLCEEYRHNRCLIFLPTREIAHKFYLILQAMKFPCAELHGKLPQRERQDALQRFRESKANFLAATDVASRGLDIEEVQVVLSYSMPSDYRVYLHRVGRTARKSHSGLAITLVGEGTDRKILKSITKNSSAPIGHRYVSWDSVAKWSNAIKATLESLGKSIPDEETCIDSSS